MAYVPHKREPEPEPKIKLKDFTRRNDAALEKLIEEYLKKELDKTEETK